MHDKTEKPIPSKGADISMGLSQRDKFNSESPESLGEGRDEDTGKPKGPEKRSIPGGFQLA